MNKEQLQGELAKLEREFQDLALNAACNSDEKTEQIYKNLAKIADLMWDCLEVDNEQ